MSDAGRQSFTDKAGAAAKPDSQKGVFEQASDYVKGTADSAAATVQPSSQKSASQKVGDTATGKDESVLDKAKHAVGLGGSNA